MSLADINGLHAAYCKATRQALCLNPASERYWFNALKAGMSPADLEKALLERQLAIARGERNHPCILLRNVCGSDEAIGDILNEAAAIRARERKPAYHPGKAKVLKATGRDSAPAPGSERAVGEVAQKALEGLRKAIQ